jgi:hypothetical protein
MTNTAKRREQAHRIAAKVLAPDEPMINEDENDMRDLMHALNWYNENASDKDRRKWVISYLAKTGQKDAVIALNDATDFELRSLAFMCRLTSREQHLAEREQEKMVSIISELSTKYKKRKKVVAVVADAKPVVSVQDRIEEVAKKHAAEFDGAIDDFVINKQSEFSAKNYLQANAVSAPVAKRIGESYGKLIDELNEVIAGDDKQLVEGYSNFTKREIKKFVTFVETLRDDCLQQVQHAKAGRAPRKRKPMSPTKLTARMKYLKDFAEFSLKSVKPETIIGSDEVWFYNTKYRRVGVYKAVGGTLSVKGTTILGFDVKESKMMTLRKPEEFFKGLAMGKRALNAALKKLTTKPAAPNGRINEETIILGAF